MSAAHGLSGDAVAKILAVFGGFPEVERAVLYGSRAKGNARPGSDIDLALFGLRLDQQLLGRIESALEDLMLPYQFDVCLLAGISHADLLDHIRRVGVVFYEKQAAA